MESGTKGNGKGQLTQSAPKAYAVSAYAAAPSTTTNYARSSNAQGYRQVAKMNTQDKQSGSYERYTAREEVSTGEMYHGRGQREYGVKDEYKTSSTVKVGDKSGYTEYHKEERFRNVSFDNGNKNQGNVGFGNGSYNSGTGASVKADIQSESDDDDSAGSDGYGSYDDDAQSYGCDSDSDSDY